MSYLAIDIGGANIKLADGKGYAHSTSFPLWLRSGQLALELRTLIAEAPACDHLAITMTGELADCFESKEQGVRFILKAVVEAADSRHTRVYLTNGKMVTPTVAEEKWQLAAASNWHALANWSGRLAKAGSALLFDIGSTTCDLIPLADGKPCAAGLTDLQRLMAGEMVYAGVERTPVCGLVDSLPYRGQQCPIAREFFATTADVYVLLGNIREDAANTHTADNRPLTKGHCRTRMGRMISAEGEDFNHRDAIAFAEAVAAAQIKTIANGLQKVSAKLGGPFDTVIFSGHGEFLARNAIESLGWEALSISLSQQLGHDISRCAPAHALAVLAREAAGV